MSVFVASKNRSGRTDATRPNLIWPARRAAPLVSLLLISGVVAATLIPAQAAAAAPVYQITAEWESGTPTTVTSGDVVTGVWRVNVNDDSAAPSNEAIDNVTFTATLENGVFGELPSACLTDGVDPISGISDDGTSLVCNLGTKDQGTAVIVQTPIEADGPTGSQLAASGSIGGQIAELTPIDIVNDFGMDIRWGTGAAYVSSGADYFEVSYEWTLSKLLRSDPGPQTITYDLTIASPQGGSIQIAPQGCTPFDMGVAADGHPWSGGDHPSTQVTSFVGNCSIAQTGPNTFQMTLTGIDYDPANIPTRDSAGNLLPTDQVALASGSVYVRVFNVPGGSATINSSAPTYTSTTGLTAPDDPSNNSETKAWQPLGTYSSGWGRGFTGSGGTTWDDTYRVAAGTVVGQYLDTGWQRWSHRADDRLVGMCAPFDTRHVTLESFVWSVPAGGVDGAPFEYYTGTSANLDPTSLGYNPSAFDCAPATGWSTTPPANLADVKAVRVVMTQGQAEAHAGDPSITPVAYLRVRPETPAGTEVWSFFSGIHDAPVPNTWTGPDYAGCITNTPGWRYPCTTGFRDVLRISDASPAIVKSVDRTAVTPGVPATYTLTYAANGAGQVPPTVDGYQISDTLPVGVTYVTGSATPAPVISVDGQGRQVLSWSLNGVTTNTQHALTYQAVADQSVTPGTVLTNTAVASYAGQTRSAAARVTISTSGYTSIGKSADTPFIPNLNGDGVGEGAWTVTLRSFDPLPQGFTDTIDILPFVGDERGTNFAGDYSLTGVDAVAGATVYYTTADPTTLSDDPANTLNGAAAGDPTGNTAGWSTTFSPEATAVRVIGPLLPAGGTQAFTVNIATGGVEGGDLLVNRAQAVTEHTELVMRTSAPITVANYYSASLKKYVQASDGTWRDANTVEDYPTFSEGDTIRYRIVVENTGQATLTGLEVSDDRQPELGSFVVDSLPPGESQTHEFEIVADTSTGDGVVNTACASADIPEDSQVPPTINCDPAGIEINGDPAHTKSLISATPTGGGQWEIVYGLEVTNTSTASTSYSLDDELHFTDQAGIVSATVTDSPDGVTLADPAWDGQGNLRVATDVPLPGNDDTGYALHHYEVTVVANVPLQLVGAGSGADDPTQCGPDGDDADRAFNNTSALTDPAGAVEEDQACAEIPSIDITKGVSAGPAPNVDGTWTVTYDIVATNTGSFEGVYEVTDQMTADGDLTVVSGAVTSAPDGVTASPAWTGLGADGAPENVIATGIALPAGGTHTYQVEVVVGIAPTVGGAPVITDCSAEPGDNGGLSNSAGIEHNDLTDAAEACISIAFITIDKSISDGPTPNGDGTWTITYDLVAENIGAAAGDYDLSDQLRYGHGIDIVGAEVIATPDGVTAEETWTGEGADLAAAENLIAGGIALDATGVHTYQIEVVVELDETTIDAADLACPAPGSGANGGLANSTSLTHNGITAEDEVCASLPLISIDKAISAGPTGNGDGTWTITYDLVASNTGEAAGDYDLADQLQYGDGIVIESAAVTAAPDGVDPNAGWTGQGEDSAEENVIATAVTLPADGTHTYQVQVVVSLDLETVTPDTLACPTPGSGETGGLANTTELTHNGEPQVDDVCASLPLIEIAKSISGAVLPVAGEPGSYDVSYEVTVTNRGPGAGSYDLDDELQPGAGIEIVGIQSVTTDAAAPVGINPGYDGVGDIRIVTAQPIEGAAGAPVVHIYTVVVRYSADLAGIEIPAGDQCTDGSGTVGGALNNVATAGWNGIEDSDDECVRPGKPTLDKALVSATPIGDGQWEVVYDLTVGNVGNEPTTYDLDDEFLFAPVITVDTVGVTGPDGVDIDPDFDGDQNQRIATGVAIDGLDDDGYAPHVYQVTVTADVPLTFDEAEEDGTGAPGCTVPAGDNTLEQGLNNAATLTDENGNEQTDTDCAQLPAFDIAKQITGTPSVNGDRVATTYEITVTNTGAAAGQYVLRDQLRYGTGLAVNTVTATNTAPGDIPILAGYTGQGAELTDAANQVTDPVELVPDGMHTYEVVVTAKITNAAGPSTTTCAYGTGSGGVRNVAAVEHNGLADDATACAPFKIPGKPAPDLASTGVQITAAVGAGAVLLLLGAALLIARRRRQDTTQ